MYWWDNFPPQYLLLQRSILWLVVVDGDSLLVGHFPTTISSSIRYHFMDILLWGQFPAILTFSEWYYIPLWTISHFKIFFIRYFLFYFLVNNDTLLVGQFPATISSSVRYFLCPVLVNGYILLWDNFPPQYLLLSFDWFYLMVTIYWWDNFPPQYLFLIKYYPLVSLVNGDSFLVG